MRMQIVALVVGVAAAAFVAGWLVRGAGAESATDPATSEPIADAPPTRAPAPRFTERAESAQVDRMRRQRDEALREVERVRTERDQPKQNPAKILAERLSETLDAATTDAVKSRADRLRASHLAQADAADATAAMQVEQEIRKERAERDDRMRGGTMAFLAGLKAKWTPPWEMLRSPEQFGALFKRQTDAGTVDGATLRYDELPADGTTIRFPPGRFALDVAKMNGWKTFPKDLVLEGAGMDATLVVMTCDFRIANAVHSFTLRDLTVDTNDNYFESNRENPYTLRVERSRIVGFDMGAGSSAMLGGSVGAFFATDSRIESGFGRHPGFGNLFDVRGALVARLENCDIVGPFNSVYYQWSGAAQEFTGCRFTRMDQNNKRMFERSEDMVEFVGCTFEYATNGERPAKRLLSELNPAWADAKKR